MTVRGGRSRATTLTVSVGAAVLGVLLVSFLVVRTGDELAPAGTRTVVTVWSIGDHLDRAGLRRAVAHAARAEGVSLSKVVQTVEDGRTVRTVYDVSGLGDAPSDGSYPSFGRSLETRYASLNELQDADVTGMYVTPSTEEEVGRLVRVLRRDGVEVTTLPFHLPRTVLWVAQELPVLECVAVSLLGVAAGAAYWAWSRRRPDAVLALHGARRVRVVAGHLIRSQAVVAVAGTFGIAATVPVLGAYDGLAQFPTFAAVAVQGTVVVALVVFATCAAVLCLESRVAVGPALAGARPRLARLALALGVHAVCLVLASSAVGAAVSTSRPLAAGAAERPLWAAAHRWHTLVLSSELDELEESLAAFADVVRDQQSRGTALLAQHPAGVMGGYDPTSGHVLIVDDQYLDEQSVLDARGRRIDPERTRPDALTLLVPEQLLRDEGSREHFVAEWEDWSEMQVELGITDGADHGEVALDVVPTRSGQRVFDYGTGPADDTSTSTDPVVAVLPSEVHVLSDDWVTSSVSQGQLLFADPVSLLADLRDHGLLDQVQAVDRAADLALVRLERQDRLLRDSTFVAVLAGLVALLSSVSFAALLVERSRRRVFLLYVSGAGPLRTLVLPALTLAMATSVALLASRAVPSVREPLSPGATAWIVVLDVLVVTVVTAAMHRRFSADTLRPS